MLDGVSPNHDTLWRQQQPEAQGQQMSETATPVRDARANYFIPPETAELFGELDLVVQVSIPPISEIGAAFRKNLKSVIDVASLPMRMANAAVLDVHWQRIHTAERIRALPDVPQDHKDSLPPENAERALTRATEAGGVLIKVLAAGIDPDHGATESGGAP